MHHFHKKLHERFLSKKKQYSYGLVTLCGVFIIFLSIFYTTRGSLPYTSELSFVEYSNTLAGSVVPASCSSGGAQTPESHFPGDCPEMEACPSGYARKATWSCYGATAYYIGSGQYGENDPVIFYTQITNMSYDEALDYCRDSVVPWTSMFFDGEGWAWKGTPWVSSPSRHRIYSVSGSGYCQQLCAGNNGAYCTSSANSCGQVNGGSIQCDGSCSASTPANPSGYGSACTSAGNACGMTNSGSIQCNGSCSASAPSDSLCPYVNVFFN